MINELESLDVEDVKAYQKRFIDIINAKREKHFNNLKEKEILINKEQSLHRGLQEVKEDVQL